MKAKNDVQQMEYEKAFSTKETPGFKLKAFGVVVLVGGLIWSGLSYFGGQGSALIFPPTVAIVGAILCGVGEMNDMHHTIIQNQLKNEYYAKYGYKKSDEE